jgi:type IV pilus assembly protein PilW
MERGSRQIENGRFAMSVLREDIALAGFYYDISQTGVAWQATAACVTDVAGMGFSNTPFQMPLPIFGYAGGTGAPACVANAVADTDVLVIRRFNTEPSCFTPTATGIVPACPTASVQANQFYVQASHCRTDTTDAPLIRGLGSAGSGTFSLREQDCTRQALLWRYREHVYYVRNFSAAAGDGIPTLVRLELDGGATRTEALVEGIQAMRIEYGLDTSGDGAPDTWRRCDAATPCTTAQWSQVTALRAYVLSSNLESSFGYSDAKTYDLGLAGTVGPFGDPFKRHVYTAVMNATNRSGLLER